jgi:hypothetical protein
MGGNWHGHECICYCGNIHTDSKTQVLCNRHNLYMVVVVYFVSTMSIFNFITHHQYNERNIKISIR